jgi:putative copper export protein
MLFKLLVILHTLGATVWVGGHLVLAVTVLPRALRERDPDRIHAFEEHFEGFGLASLLLQIITGLWLARLYIPDLDRFLAFDSYLSVYIAVKLSLLFATLALAIHARLFIIPKLTKENFNSLAFHIVGITLLAVSLAIVGAGIRLGGLT